MVKILVTGGAGMIGSNLVKSLIEKKYEVFVVDDLSRGKLQYLYLNKKPVIDFNKHFIKCDLRREEIPREILNSIDYIFHLADIVAGIEYVFNNERQIFRQNILINSNLYNSISKNKRNLKGIIYANTACSFPKELQNTFKSNQLKEEQLLPANPESGYGWSKLMGQYELELLGSELGIDICSFIFHNVYGTPCDYGTNSQVIPSLIRKSIYYPEEPFIIWGSGKQSRAFVHVKDVVNALILILEKGLSESPIQIGPDFSTTIKDIAELIIRTSGKDIEIQYDLDKPEGDKGRCANYAKAKNILGWEPKVTFEIGLKEMYNWILQDIKRNEN